MKKLSENSILYVVIFACISIIISMLFYGHPYTEMTEEKLRVYQLAITALAATVGIGTVANSAKSARISAESMELTKEKEIREQSSHLIPISPSGGFPYLIPIYKKFESDNYTLDFSDPTVGYHLLISNVNKLLENKYKGEEDSDVDFKILNVGKGTCVNLEYSFEIKNLYKYDNYYYSSEFEDPHQMYGVQYKVKAAFNKETTESTVLTLDMTDLNIENAFSRFPSDSLGEKHFSKSTIVIKGTAFKKYIDSIKPQSEESLPIPNEFIILCRQYLMATDKVIEENIKNTENRQVVNSIPIKPIGEITLSYYDESLIRLGELLPNKKSIFRYTISPKDIRDANSFLKLPFYLEINQNSSQ